MLRRNLLSRAVILGTLIVLSSCASLQVKTWFFEPKNVSIECQSVEPLVRRKDGVIVEALTVPKAEGYRCYSEADDTAWRTAYRVCRKTCGCGD